MATDQEPGVMVEAQFLLVEGLGSNELKCESFLRNGSKTVAPEMN